MHINGSSMDTNGWRRFVPDLCYTLLGEDVELDWIGLVTGLDWIGLDWSLDWPCKMNGVQRRASGGVHDVD